MMRGLTAVLFALAVGVGTVRASETRTLGSDSFSLPGLEHLRANPSSIPAARGVPEDRIEQGYLLPQCGTSSLLGYAETEAQYAEAVARWRQALAAAGIRTGTAAFDRGTWVLPYSTRDGSVIRSFLAEPRQFKPKDEDSLRANESMVLGSLAKRGVRVLSSYVVDIPELLPTYAVYYLTPAAARPEDERRIRVLKPGEDIDVALLKKAGVDILQTPESWILVYYGREVGFVTRIAQTREDAEQKLKERVDWLLSQGKSMIGSRIAELTPPEDGYAYVVEIYFYQ